jgi:hypothetical protein
MVVQLEADGFEPRFWIQSGLPTIRELTSSVDTMPSGGSNGVECGGQSAQRPANTPDPRRVKVSVV